MYNKIFTKILDSSIWLEPTSTRIVWVVFLAAMDEDGFAQFASIPNLAHRARLSVEETEEALRILESPDTNSSDPEHEGRRVERVPGGWMVLNAQKYRSMVTRTVIREQTRTRVAKHRAKVQEIKALSNCNAYVTPSETISVSKSEEKETSKSPKKRSKAQESTWEKLNSISDHPKYDTMRDDDGPGGVSAQTYEDMLHDARVGTPTARTIPDEEKDESAGK